MAQERTNYSAERREWVRDLKDKKILDFNVLDNKYIFFLALALGCSQTPKELKRAESWIQCNVYTGKERALICSALLGKSCQEEGDINEQADFMTCNKYAEKCAEAGFDEMDRIFKENNYDNDEICAYVMNELDRLYYANVASSEL